MCCVIFALYLRFCCVKYTPYSFIMQSLFSVFLHFLCFTQKHPVVFIYNYQCALFSCKYYATITQTNFVDISHLFFYNKCNYTTVCLPTHFLRRRHTIRGSYHERYNKRSGQAGRSLSVHRIKNLFGPPVHQRPDKRAGAESHAGAGL